MNGVTFKKSGLTFILLLFMTCSAWAAVPLDSLKTTWERRVENLTTTELLSSNFNMWFTRTQREEGTGDTPTITHLPAGYPAEGEILPFVRIVAQNSGGRIRYETAGYTVLGTPIPLLIVGFPKAPEGPADIGNRIVVRWQGSIHGNEPEGKEAILIFLREAAQGKHDELLRDMVLLVNPTVNPDGVDLNTRTNSQNYDLNRDWAKATTPEIRTLLKINRMWDPVIILDAHTIGQATRHPTHYQSAGKGGNVDPDISAEGQRYSESVFGYRTPTQPNFFRDYLGKFQQDNPEVVSYRGLPTLVPLHYMEGFAARDNITLDDGTVERRITQIDNAASDATRVTTGVNGAKNRFPLLLEVTSQHNTFYKTNIHYASGVSALDQAVKQKNELLAFFKGKDDYMRNLVSKGNTNDTFPIYTGILTESATSGNGGNDREIIFDGTDVGYGPDLHLLEYYAHTSLTGTTVDQTQPRSYLVNYRFGNMRHNPAQMGAFYVFDPNAETAVRELLRQGVEVHRLNKDVTLPANSTVQFYDASRPTGRWTVRKHQAWYEGVFTTHVQSGEWNPVTGSGYVARQGSYVVSTAQPFGRYGAYKLEPKSNCGLVFWTFFDDIMLYQATPPTQGFFEIAKTYSYSAIPDSALQPLTFAEDIDNEPEYPFAPPYLELNGDFSGLSDEGATVENASQSNDNGNVIITFRDAALHNGMWLTLFFYDEAGKYIEILKQVTTGETPVYEVVFKYTELIEADLQPGKKYFIHYSNDGGDIFGYGSLTKGALAFEEFKKPDDPNPGDTEGCNAGFVALAMLVVTSFAFRRK